MSYKQKNIYYKGFISFIFVISIILFSNNIFANTNMDFLKIQVPAAVVMDMESGRIIYSKNENQKRPMASLTKIITSLMLVENCNLDEEIEVPKEATIIRWFHNRIKKR